MTDPLAMMEACSLCNGVGRVACPGPKNGCYGMHMGHPCPDCQPHIGSPTDQPDDTDNRQS